MKWSFDNETFNYDSLAELIEAEEDVVAGRTVYFGEERHPGTDFVSARDVIEMIGERAYDEGGEYAEDFPRISAEADRELGEFLTNWQAKHCVPTFYSIPNVSEHVVTAEEIAEATGETA